MQLGKLVVNKRNWMILPFFITGSPQVQPNSSFSYTNRGTQRVPFLVFVERLSLSLGWLVGKKEVVVLESNDGRKKRRLLDRIECIE